MAFQYVQVAAPSPSISGFRPSKGGRPGKKITILGANLYGPSQVSFNGTNATILSSTNTRVTTRVPRGATSGPITVTTPGGTAISGKVFTVK